MVSLGRWPSPLTSKADGALDLASDSDEPLVAPAAGGNVSAQGAPSAPLTAGTTPPPNMIPVPAPHLSPASVPRAAAAAPNSSIGAGSATSTQARVPDKASPSMPKVSTPRTRGIVPRKAKRRRVIGGSGSSDGHAEPEEQTVRQIERRPAPPNREHVASLMAMGFPQEAVEAALLAEDGDVAAAADALLMGGDEGPQASGAGVSSSSSSSGSINPNFVGQGAASSSSSCAFSSACPPPLAAGSSGSGSSSGSRASYLAASSSSSSSAAASSFGVNQIGGSSSSSGSGGGGCGSGSGAPPSLGVNQVGGSSSSSGSTSSVFRDNTVWGNSSSSGANPCSGPSPGVQQLISMGFDRRASEEALQSASGDVATAAAVLLGDVPEEGEGEGEDVQMVVPEGGAEAQQPPSEAELELDLEEEAEAEAEAEEAPQGDEEDEDGDWDASGEEDEEDEEIDDDRRRGTKRGRGGGGRQQQQQQQRGTPSTLPNILRRAAPVPEVQRASPLASISARAKASVVAALVGPDSQRTARVEGTIRRGRVALRKNHWDKHEEESLMEGTSECYKQLKGYQRVGVRWLLSLANVGLGGILADEMGLGKTAETLAFLDIRFKMLDRSKQARKPVLIVVPASLIGNWMAEVSTWCPHLQVFKYYASNINDRAGLADEYFRLREQSELILTTPGVLSNKQDRQFFFRRLHFDYLIYDEAHGVKNCSSQRFQDIYKGLKVDHRLLLTGTPVQNSLKELANLLSLLLAQNKLPDGVKKPPHYKEAIGAVEELHDLVDRKILRTLQVRAAPFILRRLKKDVMKDLPPKKGAMVTCALATKQQQHYDRELAEARAECAKGKVRRDFVKNLFARLRRITNHPLLGQSKLRREDYELLISVLSSVRSDFQKAPRAKVLSEVLTWSDYDVASTVQDYGVSNKLPPYFTVTKSELIEGSAKVKQLLNLLRAQQKEKQKTLVFSQFTQFLDLIVDVLRLENIKFARLDGGTAIAERPEIVQNFQDPNSGLDVFLLSTKAGGVGLNLTAANTVVLMDLSFNPQDNRQAEDRVHRLGQTKPVNVYYFVCKGTIEEQVLQTNLDKMALDYKFGGQRNLLHGQVTPGNAEIKALGVSGPEAGEDDDDEDDDQDDDDEDVADDSAAKEKTAQQEAKKAEQSALAALERACLGR